MQWIPVGLGGGQGPEKKQKVEVEAACACTHVECYAMRNCCASCWDVHVPCAWTHVWCYATTAFFAGMRTFLALAHIPFALIPCCWNREPVGTFKKVTSWRNFSRKHIPASNMCSCATNVITSHPMHPTPPQNFAFGHGVANPAVS